MIRKCTVSIKEVESVLKDYVLNNMDTPKVIFHKHSKPKKFEAEICGEKIHALSDRYKTFFTKGYKCSCCGIEGKYFALEKDENSKRYHLNLYAVKDDGTEVLMTKDHIIPKSKGGTNHIENYQTMCQECNVNKGNKL